MTTNDDDKRKRDESAGLEHQHATPEGELMTAAGSTTRDPDAGDDNVTLDDNPGLEHDEATEAGKMMTGRGSIRPDKDRR